MPAMEDHSLTHGPRRGNSATHWSLVRRLWRDIHGLRRVGNVIIDGESLDVAAVVAVSRYGVISELDGEKQFREKIDRSVDTLINLLSDKRIIYGVNTGFGGSANVRTQQTLDLQSSLLQHLHIGILSPYDRGSKYLGATPEEDGPEDVWSHAMPRSWVKGTMLIRCNTVSRGHSAVTFDVIQQLSSMLSNNIVPVIPLRGSVSASGDLSPLSYVAGALTGNPDIMVHIGKGKTRRTVPSNEALQMADLDPIELGPKEGLGLLNGTATSAAVASLALFDSHNLLMLSQALTSMACEALLGNIGSFDPFLAQVRPHPGQVEVSSNIHVLLQGSLLAKGLHGLDHSKDVGLYQDRYPLRTSSQWLGPQIEDLLLAQQQVTIELNSTTDNPLVSASQVHHGGNFQAASITSAMEKTRLSLQMIGKLLFAQCSELINPTLSNGLPPNLAADEPSLSFTCKGIDTSMASYMSELAFLANPVSSHVQSAEMHNQAINSLALISARQTVQAVEVTMLMAAAYIFVVCQALDIRVMLDNYYAAISPALKQLNERIWRNKLLLSDLAALDRAICKHAIDAWAQQSQLDSEDRAHAVADSCLSIIASFLLSNPTTHKEALGDLSSDLTAWKTDAQSLLLSTYKTTRSSFFDSQDTASYLGTGAKAIYTFVRSQLNVPFFHGLSEHPRANDTNHSSSQSRREKKNIGSYISTIHQSLRNGNIFEMLVSATTLGDSSENENEKMTTNGSALNNSNPANAKAGAHSHTNGNANGNAETPSPSLSLSRNSDSAVSISDHINDADHAKPTTSKQQPMAEDLLQSLNKTREMLQLAIEKGVK